MIDLNHVPDLSEIANKIIDKALEKEKEKEPVRDYLGGSIAGKSCERAIQYQYFNARKDKGKEFKGGTLKIFERGFWAEEAMAAWLRNAGFTLLTEDDKGKQFGFALHNGRVQGHCDGVITAGPLQIKYPALWENKGIKKSGKSGWNQLKKHKLKKAYPVYFAQVQYYQKYFNLTENPAVFTAICMDDMKIHWESVPHDPDFTATLDAKVERVLLSCKHGEILPRQFHSKNYYECKWCSWYKRCWEIK